VDNKILEENKNEIPFCASFQLLWCTSTTMKLAKIIIIEISLRLSLEDSIDDYQYPGYHYRRG